MSVAPDAIVYDVPQQLSFAFEEEVVATVEPVVTEEPVVEPKVDKLPEFDPRCRQDFEGLLYLGRLTSTFKWSGHKIKIQTIDQGAYLEVSELIRQYEGGLAGLQAQMTAMVAACLVSIDGKGFPVPLMEDESEIDAKFQWVLKLHPFAINAIYEKFDELEYKVKQVLDEMGKARGAELPPGLDTTSELPNEGAFFINPR